MATRKKIIKVPQGNVKKLAEKHGFTMAAVYNALSYNSNSETAQLIRKQALDLYGGIATTKIVF